MIEHSRIEPAEGQRAPREYDEAVELWARQWGRHGSVEYSRGLHCWCIHLSRRPSDPLMREYQEGRLRQSRPPTESIPLHEWSAKEKSYVAIPLDELGAAGLLELLERGNTWSGRGEVSSLTEGVLRARQHNKEVRERNLARANEMGRDVGDLARRGVFDLAIVQSAGLPSDTPSKSLNTPTKES